MATVAAPTANLEVASIQLADGRVVVSVAQPVVVQFTKPIAGRAAAEQFITIPSSNKRVGRLLWLDDHVVQ